MCAGLVLTEEVQVEYQAPITVLFLLSSLKYFFFQLLQKLFAFGFDSTNQELYQTIAVILQLICLSEASRRMLFGV